MKIGLVRRGYSPTGGAEAYVGRFAEAARAAGHECVLFGSAEWDNARWDGERVLVAGATPLEFADALRAVQPRDRCDFLFQDFDRVWECDAYRAGDGVHAAWLERRTRFEPAWRSFFRRFSRKHRQILKLERALFRGGARIVIANSQLVKDEIIERFGTPPERIHVIYNGVPQWRDEPGLRGRKRAELGLNENDYAVLFAGSGWERKGLRFAIDAVNGLTSATLLVAGRGKMRGLPRSERARFLGPQTQDELHALFAAADAFVLPTIYDPFSNACLEALAAGLPVITTKANGFAEIIEPGVEGEVIVAPDDIPALRAVIAVWADPAKRADVRERLLAKGAAFSIERNVAQTLALIGS